MHRVLKIELHVLRIFLEDNACPLTSVCHQIARQRHRDQLHQATVNL